MPDLDDIMPNISQQMRWIIFIVTAIVLFVVGVLGLKFVPDVYAQIDDGDKAVIQKLENQQTTYEERMLYIQNDYNAKIISSNETNAARANKSDYRYVRGQYRWAVRNLRIDGATNAEIEMYDQFLMDMNDLEEEMDLEKTKRIQGF
jgi:competence protein ComGC